MTEQDEVARSDAAPVTRDAPAVHGVAGAPPRLTPRPEKGLPFNQALDEIMADHHAVFAALAK